MHVPWSRRGDCSWELQQALRFHGRSHERRPLLERAVPCPPPGARRCSAVAQLSLLGVAREAHPSPAPVDRPTYQTDLDRGVEYFELLGVTALAERVEIVRAFRERIRRVHPDISGSRTEAEVLIRARETLLGPEAAAYWQAWTARFRPRRPTVEPPGVPYRPAAMSRDPELAEVLQKLGVKLGKLDKYLNEELAELRARKKG